MPSKYAGRVVKTDGFVFGVSSSSFRSDDVFVSVEIATAAVVGEFVPVIVIVIVTGGVVADDDPDDDIPVAGKSAPWFSGVVFPSVVR